MPLTLLANYVLARGLVELELQQLRERSRRLASTLSDIMLHYCIAVVSVSWARVSAR